MKYAVMNIKNLFAGVRKSKELRDTSYEILENAIDALYGNPMAIGKLTKAMFSIPAFLPNILFWENFNCFVNGINYDPELQMRFCEQFDIEGKREEHAKKIIKAIEEIDSQRKMSILLNLTKALSFGMIEKKVYYRLSRLLPDLSDEDIDYLKYNIKKGNFEEDEYTDDFIAYGLIRQTNEGFAYNKCAFEFVQYGIEYGHSITIPEDIPQRISGGVEIIDLDES